MKLYLLYFIYLFLFIYTIERSVFAIVVPFKVRLKKRNWLTILPILTYGGIFFSSIYEFSVKVTLLNLTITLVGFVSFCVGVIFRYQAAKAFQRTNQAWISSIDSHNIHSIVSGGIYKYMRHPYYLSVVLELGGVCLMLNALRTIFALVIQVLFLWRRINVEESMLLNKFGEEYASYKMRIPLIPFWRKITW